MRGSPAAVVLALAALAAGGCRRAAEPEAFLPEFTVTSVGAAAETPFGRRDMLGRVWIADFIYTRCGGPCPLMTSRMAALAGSLPPEVRLLTVSVDPDDDTPARLRAYARRYGADSARWVFARGSLTDTYKLLYEGFRLPLSVDPAAPPESRALHSTRFVLVDRRGGVRGYYDGLDDLATAALARDAKRLLEAGS